VNWEEFVLPAIVAVVTAIPTAYVTMILNSKRDKKKTVFDLVHPRAVGAAEAIYRDLYQVVFAADDYINPPKPGPEEDAISGLEYIGDCGVEVVNAVNKARRTYSRDRIYLPSSWQDRFERIIDQVGALSKGVHYDWMLRVDVPDRKLTRAVSAELSTSLDTLAKDISKYLYDPNAVPREAEKMKLSAEPSI
jgi:hypothetical protein